jgi:hypothetical protein
MNKPQQIILEKKENWSSEDFEKIKEIFPHVGCKEDCIELWKNNSMVRIADSKDYEYLYEDFIHETETEISFDDFMCELEKGYGKSDFIEIARIFELSNGIWYDNEYC